MTDLLSDLNPQQQTAVKHMDGPLLVVAGAGSGKTRVITRRIAYLIAEQGVPHYRILAITFTNKAANEMKTRVADLLEGTLSRAEIAEMWVSTFHSACVRILRRHAPKLGYPEQFSIYDTADSKRVYKAVLNELGVDTKRLPVSRFLNLISKAKNDFLSPDQLLEQAEERGIFDPQLVDQAYRLYQSRLTEAGAMDFDDLLLKTCELFAQYPDVLEWHQRKFQHILVDEFQDTNAVQNRLILMLVSEHGNICAVGDADQSIYRFRGADIRNIAQLETELPKNVPNLTTVLLEENYRSTQNILDAANNVISHNPSRISKVLRAHRQAAGGGRKVQVYSASSDREEAYWVADQIMSELRIDHYLSADDFAVLYRTNAQSVLLEDTFSRMDIPHQVVGSVGFFERREIRDCLAYVRAVVNPQDQQSIARVINIPARGIGAKTLTKLVAFARQMDLPLGEALLFVDEAGVSARARQGVREFAELCEQARLSFEAGPTEVLRMLLEDSGYLGELRKLADEELELSNISEAEGRLENIQMLLDLAQGYDTVEDFVDFAALVTRNDDAGVDDSFREGSAGYESDSRVSLMTVHAAKGLEFKYVFVIGMEDGVFPHQFSIDDPDELEEERRLAYVAMTRAQDRLCLSWSASRMTFGEMKYNIPSRFLDEVGDLDGGGGAGVSDAAGEAGGDNLFGSYFGAENGSGVGGGGQAGMEAAGFSVNDQISHRRWGTGKVLKVSGSGATEEIVVDFASVGEKLLLASVAPIEKV